MRYLLPLLLAACSSPQVGEHRPRPVALPGIRHGHRVEASAAGLLCFGGFARTGSAPDRGARQTWLLAPGATTWQPRADLVHEHAFFGSAVIDGTAYAIGETVERYDAEADRWHVVTAPGALPRSHFAAAAHRGQIFVLGGFPPVGTGFASVDPETGTVTSAAPPPGFAHGDHFHFLCSLAGELHLIGGMRNDPFETMAEHWVRRGGQWLRLPDAPVGMWAKFGLQAQHEGQLYLFGEFGGHAYDPSSAKWRRCRPLPAMIAMPAAIPVGDDIWVVGGQAVEGPSNVLWRYDVRADRWHELQP